MNEKVIALLNEARKRELHAIIQYMSQHYELENDGYGKLGDRLKEIALTEMKHAEELAERILFLGGVPVTKPDADAKKGVPIAEMLNIDLGLEKEAVTFYNEAANACAAEGDNVSKAIFEKLLHDEDEHVDEFQTSIEHLEKLGDVYLATLID